MRTFLTLFFSVCVMLATNCQAQDLSAPPTADSGFSNSGINNPVAATSAQPTFLPVEQAFQLQPFLKQDAKRQLQLLWDIAPHYYLYQHRFKLTAVVDGEPRTLAPEFASNGESKYDEYFEKELVVFYNGVEINAALPAYEQLELQVQSQGCADAGLCYPPQTQRFSIDTSNGQILPLSASSPTQPGAPSAAESGSTANYVLLPYILLLAVTGGIILNLMPCVFPVLSIKALSLAGAHQSNQRQHLHGWMYTAGVVAAFVVVATIMLIARAGGEAVGWGFQLQSPILVSLLAYLFFAMGLSLSGLVTFGARLMGMGQNLTGGHGLRSSFFTGVLAAVVASPCTAPFMGTALGYALTQPAIVSLAIFAALGIGMALPFLLLSYVPRLGHYLPEPGHWMETLRQCLAFPLYLAAIWLLWVLGRQAGSDSVALVCVGGLLIALAFWLSHHAIRRKTVQALLVGASMVTALTIPFGLTTVKPDPSLPAVTQGRWQPYSPEKLQQLQAEGRPVFVNLTADWCLTCLANERITLHSEAVERAFDNNQVATLKGDWTNYNADITRLLNKYGRSGVPLYLMFPANGKRSAQVLPQLLSQEILINAIEMSIQATKSNRKNAQKSTLTANH